MTKVDRPEPNPDEQPGGRRRRRALLIAGAVVVAAVLAVAISVAAVRGAQNAQNAQSASGDKKTAFQLPTPDTNSPPPPAASPTPSASSGGAQAAPKPDARYGAPVAAVVSRDDTATLSGGLTAKLEVEKTNATAVRAGEVSGSAVQVKVELRNPGASDVSLSQVAVNAYYGSKSIPATELSDGAQPLLGTLKAGETRTGVYVFSVPADQTGAVVITATDAAGTPITVFK
ncbi:hypothetical protein [Leifsonia shinshuensis]|uniref:hypothetical protein n=1 Tax=Leifsonia shinshuensis TaxID=150026 RepID=UPI00285F6133|nr:hypothetical protein [Leifsonia shinshuensis]MDR6971735.1 cytoskeletal protein RodZ [Leifsonia shinshuensis]